MSGTNDLETPFAHVALEEVAAGPIAPTDFAVASDTGRRYVTDQTGEIRVLTDDGFAPEPFLDLRDRVVDLLDDGDERGLVGLAFHPSFETNRTCYVRYSASPRPGTPDDYDHTSVLAAFEVSPDGLTADLDSERTIMELPQPGVTHNGGQLAFGPDGHLYLSIGDGGHMGDTGLGHVEGGNGQDIADNLLGSILRIDVDGGTDAYSIPEDNPLVENDEGFKEQYAWGFRNPWRMSFDSRGRLFTGDVGQSLFEEVDLVEKGGNYGWNIKEGTHCFDPDAMEDPPEDCADESPRGEPLLDPIVEYPHERDGEPIGCAVIGGFVYEGNAIQDLVGAYVFGDVSRRYDEPAGRLFVAIPPDGDGGWTHRSIGIEGTDDNHLDGYLYTLGRDSDGELYALTCSHLEPGRSRRGHVYQIIPSRHA
ncbi:PQQ-dependent sugar dehydrogenase [Haladaptatus halobius]|uniref:PQQ-dependent sugar dehydrogenase n=1 Tax=Haladaptatus halobius TaxID=2884875 RepID=UPI001D0A1074|nr:PQQ-dependent sugar dehydrogenase [Haladaptatus halobius]